MSTSPAARPPHPTLGAHVLSRGAGWWWTFTVAWGSAMIVVGMLLRAGRPIDLGSSWRWIGVGGALLVSAWWFPSRLDWYDEGLALRQRGGSTTMRWDESEEVRDRIITVPIGPALGRRISCTSLHN